MVDRRGARVLAWLMLVGTYRATQAGAMLYAAVPSPNTAFGGAVAAIDGGTLTVTTTIPIAQASGQPYALAVSSDGQYVYSLNSKCNGPPFPPPVVPGTVSVISTATNTVMATVTVGTCPQAIAVSPDGKRLYVAHNASAAGVPAGVEVLDTSTPAAATAITDFVESSTVVTANGSLGAVRSMALAPDGRHLYVAWDDNGAQAGVDVVDSTTGAIVATMSLGTTSNGFAVEPSQVAVAPDGSLVYATASNSTFDLIDALSNGIAASGALNSGPLLQTLGGNGLVVAPDGKHAYLVDNEFNTVGVIDPAAQAATVVGPPASLSFFFSAGIAVSPDSKSLYMGDIHQGLLVLDAASLDFTTAKVVPLGAPAAIALAILAVGNTPASASPVTVPLVDPATGVAVQVTFAAVSNAGSTTISASGSCTPLNGYAFASPSICFDLATTALVTAPITVCVDTVTVPSPLVPTLMHYVGGVPNPVPTTVTPGALAGTSNVCGTVSSLSPFGVLGHDITPPVLQLPSAIAVDATGPDGAVVTYVATATDDLDPNPVMSCAPPSGSLFPIDQPGASTQVSCLATDAAGNTCAPGTFPVHVRGSAEQVQALSDLVASFQLDEKLAQDIRRGLRQVAHDLARGRASAACRALAAVVDTVQECADAGGNRWRSLPTVGEAAQLVIGAERVEAVLSCASPATTDETDVEPSGARGGP